MTAAFVRYLPSRFLSPWIWLVAGPVEIANHFARGRPWRGEWLWGIDWAGTSLIIIGPMVAAVCAIDAGRLAGAGHALHLDSSPRPWRFGLLIAAAGTAVAGTVHLLAVLATVLANLAANDVPPPPAVAVMMLVQSLGLAFFAALGVAVGMFAGAVVGAVAAAGVALQLIWSTDGGGFDLLALGSATSSLAGYRVDPAYYGLQVGLLGAAVLVLLTVRSRPTAIDRRRLTRLGLLGLVAVGALVVVPPQLAGSGERFVLAADVTPTACVDGDVRVCLYAEHARLAAPISAELTGLYRAAARRGVGDLLPREYREKIPGSGVPERGIGWIPLGPDELEQGRLSTVQLAALMAGPLHCAQLYADRPPSERYWTDLHGVTAYLTSAEALGEVTGQPVRVPTRSQARAILERFRSCAF